MKKILLSIATILSLNSANAQCSQAGLIPTHVFSSTSATVIPSSVSGVKQYYVCSGSGAIVDSSNSYNKVVFLETNTTYTMTEIIGGTATATVYLKGTAKLVISSSMASPVYAYMEPTATLINNSTPTSVTITTCSSIISPTVGDCSSSVSINDLTNNSSLSIYPNPAKDVLTVETATNFSNNSVIEITDVLGKVVLTEALTSTKQSITISNLINGVYFISCIENGNKTKIQKFIKQ